MRRNLFTRTGLSGVSGASLCGRFLVVLCSQFILTGEILSQKPDLLNTLDVSRVRVALNISSNCRIEFFPGNAFTTDSLTDAHFQDTISNRLRRNMPAEFVEKNIAVRFSLSNHSDSTQEVYFFPGFYFESIRLFTVHESNQPPEELVPGSIPDDTQDGYRLIVLKPGEEETFICLLKPVRTTINGILPRIVQKSVLAMFKNSLVNSSSTINLLSNLASGILLLMIFYSIAVYLQNFNTEFLYYIGYAFFTGLLLFLESFLYDITTPFHFLFEGCIDFMIQCTGVIFYLVFIRRFLDAGKNFPFLAKLLRFSQWLTILLAITYTLLYVLTSKFILPNFLETITKQLWLAVALVFIVYGIQRRNKLLNYLVAGQAIQLVFSIISLLLIVTNLRFSAVPGSILNNSLLYYIIGLLLELICFLAGLAYKNRTDIIDRVKERERLKLENERKEFEKQVAVLQAKQEERNRISADMHDELGSGVTAIRLMSEIVKTKMMGTHQPEIDKISNSANELLTKMNTIIWTMTSSNDSVESLVAYIRAYAAEFFESTPVGFHFSAPAQIPLRELSGEKRRNIFLCVKEALNNVLKHAHATDIHLDIQVTDTLCIEIRDNGSGIDLAALRKFGNGIQNMKKRMESIGGKFEISNASGTLAIFEVGL